MNDGQKMELDYDMLQSLKNPKKYWKDVQEYVHRINNQQIGGEKTEMKISETASISDSISLAKIGENPFTIVALEDSDYEEQGEITPGVKITTKETFTHNGEKYTKLHTTRITITNRFRRKNKNGELINSKIHDLLASGETIGPVKCVSVKAKRGGKDYFNLVDV